MQELHGSYLPRKYGYKLKLKLPDEEWKYPYLAALIDGEGSIIRRKEARILTVANTDEGLMDWLKQNFGGMVGLGRQPNLRSKAQWKWVLSTMPDILLLLREIIPYLTIKKNKALNMMEDIETRLNNHGFLPTTPMFLVTPEQRKEVTK